MDTLRYVWICLDIFGYGIQNSLHFLQIILDTFGYANILDTFGYFWIRLDTFGYAVKCTTHFWIRLDTARGTMHGAFLCGTRTDIYKTMENKATWTEFPTFVPS